MRRADDQSMLRLGAVARPAHASSAKRDDLSRLPGDDARVLCGVVVSYRRFTERRELRGRVMAALESREHDCTIDAEFRAVEHVNGRKSLDETS